jgi:hypothetical protein
VQHQEQAQPWETQGERTRHEQRLGPGGEQHQQRGPVLRHQRRQRAPLRQDTAGLHAPRRHHLDLLPCRGAQSLRIGFQDRIMLHARGRQHRGPGGKRQGLHQRGVDRGMVAATESGFGHQQPGAGARRHGVGPATGLPAVLLVSLRTSPHRG